MLIGSSGLYSMGSRFIKEARILLLRRLVPVQPRYAGESKAKVPFMTYGEPFKGQHKGQSPAQRG